MPTTAASTNAMSIASVRPVCPPRRPYGGLTGTGSSGSREEAVTGVHEHRPVGVEVTHAHHALPDDGEGAATALHGLPLGAPHGGHAVVPAGAVATVVVLRPQAHAGGARVRDRDPARERLAAEGGVRRAVRRRRDAEGRHPVVAGLPDDEPSPPH